MKKAIVETTLKRSNGFCEVCGDYGDGMALHHRKLKSRGGKDEVSNLLVCHHQCHNLGTDSIHLNPEKSERKGWMVPSWADPKEYPLHYPGGEIVLLQDDGSMKVLRGQGWE